MNAGNKMIQSLMAEQDNKKGDEWTSIRSHQSTVKKLEEYKVHQKESLENVIIRAVGTHGRFVEIKKRKKGEIHGKSN